MNSPSRTKGYMWSIVALGFLCLALAVSYLPWERLDFNSLLLLVFTIGFGSRITLKIPRFKSHIAVSDTFIFVALLVYGGQIAIVLAAIEALFSSWRFCKKKFTVAFNVAAMALSTSLVVGALVVLNLKATPLQLVAPDPLNNFFVILSVMALVQFVANTTTTAIYGALKSGKPFWETWKSQYAWTFVTYFVGAFSAGALLQMTEIFGFSVVIAAFPIVFFIFLSYRMYVQNMEMSLTQAEQAKKYAEILEERSIALRESEERFRSAFNYAPIGIALVSPGGSWLKVNRALGKILGYSDEEFLATDFQSMIFQEDLSETLERIESLLAGETPNCQMEHRYVHKTKKTVWASWSASTVVDSKSDQSNMIFQIQDITDRKLAEKRLHYEATHDALTELPNRAFFMARLEQALKTLEEEPNHQVCILFIDLDRFKIVNDSLGHFYGDRMLIEIAARLRQCLRPNDIVARLGGDEFTILVEGKYEDAEIIRIAERIQEKFSIPFSLADQQAYTSASIGILHVSDKHLTAEDLMRDADTAMYQAKRAGKGRHETFDENMHEEAKAVLMLENDLRSAVENDDLTLHYQPIFSIDGAQIEGFEALARWEHENLGSIPRDKFIPLAEEIGLIEILGLQILRKACAQGKMLRPYFPDDSSFSITLNLSGKQFASPHLAEQVAQVMNDTGFAAEHLKLEVSETAVLEIGETAAATIRQLSEIGVEVCIDKFGKGLTTLTSLMGLPITSLKFDHALVNAGETEGPNLEILETIINLAQSSGIRVVAGGVETRTQLAQMKSLKFESALGHVFAKPMNFEAARQYLENGNPGGIPMIFDELPIASTLQQ